MHSVMDKQRKAKWEKKACGCVKTRLPRAGNILIRCTKHRGKPSSRAGVRSRSESHLTSVIEEA